MANLNIDIDNTIQTLTSSDVGDLLDVFLAGNHPSTMQHLCLDLIRNCCTEQTITLKVAPDYQFSLELVSYTGYVPSPPQPAANDGRANFRILGIDPSLIETIEVETNASDPNGGTYQWETIDVDIATGTGIGYRIYYLIGGLATVRQIRVTTIDGYIYLLDATYTPPLNIINPPIATVVVNTPPALNTGMVVDYIGNEITFTPEAWNQSTDDNKFLDGVYQYNLTEVHTDPLLNRVDSVNMFFNIQLKCLINNYIADNLQDLDTAMILNALDESNLCDLPLASKCKLYDSLIRKLLLASQIKRTSPLGCQCGCS